MTYPQFCAHAMQRVMQVINLVDVKEKYNQGYTHKEIAEYVYAMTMIQVKKDIIPITIAETSALTGAPIDYVTERMVELLKSKAQKEQGGKDA